MKQYNVGENQQQHINQWASCISPLISMVYALPVVHSINFTKVKSDQMTFELTGLKDNEEDLTTGTGSKRLS